MQTIVHQVLAPDASTGPGRRGALVPVAERFLQ